VQGDQSVDSFDGLYTRIEANFCGLEGEANENEEIFFEEEEEIERKNDHWCDIEKYNAPPQ
jgi:hypothetical protein